MPIRLPWDDPGDSNMIADAAPRRPAAAPPARPRGRPRWTGGPATLSGPAAKATGWRLHHLIIAGPDAALAAFAAAARGPGVTPWRLDFSVLEEDIFNLAAAQPAGQRRLGIAGCRILARQFRERVEARHARALALLDQPSAQGGCPFDLHRLLPVPDAILQLGPTHPEALAWLASRWGVTDRLRRVVRLPKPGRPRGEGLIGYGFYTAGETPDAAIAALAAGWPLLHLRLQARPGD